MIEEADRAELSGTADDSPHPAGEKEKSEVALRRGEQLGKYIIVDELGAGGMGIVYSAFDPDLNRKVAVKVLRKSWDQVARARLLREAQAMAKLSHPNVVTIFEVGTDRGRDFIAMECIDGKNLDEWSREKHASEEVLAAYLQAGSGLAAAHRANVIHRDFKPHNVLIDRDGRVRVTDFGLAHQIVALKGGGALEEDCEDVSISVTGAVLGTPAYMAPEQHLGRVTDARSDQFSFCLALYEALAGKRAFVAETAKGLSELLVSYDTAPLLPETAEVGDAVRSALARGMSKAQEDRFASMEELLDELRVQPKGPRRIWIAGIAVAAVAAAGIAFFAGARSSQTDSGCVADTSLLRGVWDSDAQSEVKAAFLRTGMANAEPVYDKFAAILSAYGQGIVQMRLSLCRESRNPKGVDDNLVVLQMSCLQKRKRELGALRSAFAKVDYRGVDHAVDAAHHLSDLSECADTDTLLRGVDRPAPQIREEVLTLQAHLEEAESQGEAWHVKDAIVQAQEVRKRALELAYKPLIAEVHQVLGVLYGKDLRIREAEESFDEAILAAEESGHTECRAKALTNITKLIAGGSSRFREARRYARRANAAIAQWGKSPELHVDVAVALAGILMQEGKVEEALELTHEALGKYQEQSDVQALYVAKLQYHLAVENQLMGRFSEALEFAKASYQRILSELGDGNVRTMGALEQVAICNRMLGDYDAARELDVKIRAFWRSDKAESLLEEDEDYIAEARTVSGVVQEVSGKSISEATVVCAQRISADSHYIDSEWSFYSDAVDRKRVTTSDERGEFHCEGTTTKALVVMAEDAESRSPRSQVNAGLSPVDGLVLVVSKTGALAGKVEVDLGPQRVRVVYVIYLDDELGATEFAATTLVQDDGSYQFDRLAPGTYRVFSGTADNSTSGVVNYKVVHIESGQEAKVDFEASIGTSKVELTLKGKGGAPLHSAQVLIVQGHLDVATGKELNLKIVDSGPQLHSDFYSEGQPLLIDELRVGLHSVCVIPLGGDYRDPEYMKQFNEKTLEIIPVYCEDVHLKEGETLKVNREILPWTPPVVLDENISGGVRE